MTVKKVVIIGGVAGGMSAATRLRRRCESTQIVVFDRGPYVSFANCGLPYHLGGEIADRNKLIVQSPERLRAVFNLDVRANSEVTAIDRAARQVAVTDRATGRVYREDYEHLILSPGAAPVVPPLPGIDRPGHFTLRTIPDMDGILAWVRSRDAKTACVVGGGYIGVEAAEQLQHLGLSVTLVEALPQILRPFDAEMVAPVHQELRSNEVSLRLGHAVAGFEAAAKSERALASVVTLKNGIRVPADVVILALGVRPETTLAAESGLELGPARGIKVDEYLRSSDPHVWAVGDAIEVTHGVTKRPSLIALAGPANRQGRLVADNIIGPPKAYPGTLGTAVVRVFGLTAACTGANEELLKAAGIPFAAVHLHPNQHAGYFPGAKPLAMKLLYSPQTGAVLGAQAVGPDGADKRIDVLATAIRAGMTVDDVADLELCYAPSYGSAKDPVNLAGMVAQNTRAGFVESVHWHELAGFDPTESLVLDVRDAKERDGGTIPGSVHIPLGELRHRLTELPKDKLILAHCASGQRSYNACRLLSQHGFRCRNLSGSYKTWAAGTSFQTTID